MIPPAWHLGIIIIFSLWNRRDASLLCYADEVKIRSLVNIRKAIACFSISFVKLLLYIMERITQAIDKICETIKMLPLQGFRKLRGRITSFRGDKYIDKRNILIHNFPFPTQSPSSNPHNNHPYPDRCGEALPVFCGSGFSGDPGLQTHPPVNLPARRHPGRKHRACPCR